MNFSFVNKNFFLVVLGLIFVWFVFQPLEPLSEQEKFLFSVLVFVVVYFVLPFVEKFLDKKPSQKREISFRDLKEDLSLFHEIKTVLAYNGYFYLSEGYRLSLSRYRKRFNLVGLHKSGCVSLFCLVDPLVGAEKILVSPVMPFSELVRLHGAKNVLDLGQSIVKSDNLEFVDWLSEGKEKWAFNAMNVLEEKQ